MKKLLLYILLLSTGTVLALEDISLNVVIPEKVSVGENFTIDVYVKLKRNISGFECSIDTPIYGSEYIRFIDVTENLELKERAGNFYMLNLENDSVFISFALLDKPLGSDFHLFTVKGEALKEGNLTVRVTVVASDEEGNAIRLPPLTYKLEIVGGNQDKKEKEENIFSWIIEIISSLLRRIFGG